MHHGQREKSQIFSSPQTRSAGLRGCVPLTSGHCFFSPGCQIPSQTCALHSRIFTRLSLILGKQEWQGSQPHCCHTAGTRSSPCSPRAFSSPCKTLLPFSSISPHPAHSFHVLSPMALSLPLALIMKCVVCCAP